MGTAPHPSRPPRLLARAGGAALTVGVLVLLAGRPALAGTYHAGDGESLTAAVASADATSGASTIELSPGTYLPGGTLTIRRDITITGPSSAPGAQLGGSGVAPFPSDLLLVEAGAKLTLSNLDVTGGGGEGTTAAIDDFGAVALEDTTLSGNPGAGLWVEPDATATVRDSTLSYGLAFGLIDDGSATLENVTVAANRQGGIQNRGTLDLVNTIVAQNREGDCEGRATASDHSLDSDGSCGVGALGHTAPGLGPLKNNGGPTLTEALEAGSPAIGAGDASRCPAEDQRHLTRPGSACDIGAYQSSAVAGGSQGSPSGGPGAGAGGSAGAGVPGPSAVSAHGTLRGPRHSRITFTVRAARGRARATLTYSDRARHVAIVRLTLSSLAFNLADGVATIHGNAIGSGGRRRRVTLVLIDHRGHRSLRIGLAGGYHESAPLASGSIAFT
jgi:hypothetical protein